MIRRAEPDSQVYSAASMASRLQMRDWRRGTFLAASKPLLPVMTTRTCGLVPAMMTRFRRS